MKNGKILIGIGLALFPIGCILLGKYMHDMDKLDRDIEKSAKQIVDVYGQTETM